MAKSRSRTQTASRSALIGTGGERQDQAGGAHPALTTNQGLPLSDNQNSLRPTPRGPTLLEDFILREKITHFDHERIPERIVHARGSAAHGYFRLSKSLKKYTTRADPYRGRRRDATLHALFHGRRRRRLGRYAARRARFCRQVLYQEGNWDLVGNNIPVFFIQDAMKFPDLIHAVKMEPDRAFPQAGSAHDTFWDFISLTPEAMHMIMWAMSDRAIPRSLRMMEGFGVHSFRLVNEAGESTFVKFHWRPRLGMQSTVWDEAVKLQAADNDFHRRDLFEAIEAGNFPGMGPRGAAVHAEGCGQIPVRSSRSDQADSRGARSVDRDRHDDAESMAGQLLRGDRAGRVLSVAHRSWHRFLERSAAAGPPLFLSRHAALAPGSPNFHQIPINAPKCPFANQQRDGHMQMQVPKGRVAYEPSSLDAKSPRASSQGFRSFAEQPDDGAKGRIRAESFADHYSQARLFFRSQTEIEQAHIASSLVFELSKVETGHVRLAVLAQLQNIDVSLAKRVAAGLGLDALPAPTKPAAPVRNLELSPALRIIDRMKPTLQGRCIGILVSEGTDMGSVNTLTAAAKKAGAKVKLVAPKVAVRDSKGRTIKIDGQLAGTSSTVFDAVASVLSLDEGKRLSREGAAVDWFRDAFGHLKAIAACNGTRLILNAGGITPDAGIVKPEETAAFLKLAATRQWSRESQVRTLS